MLPRVAGNSSRKPPLVLVGVDIDRFVAPDREDRGVGCGGNVRGNPNQMAVSHEPLSAAGMVADHRTIVERVVIDGKIGADIAFGGMVDEGKRVAAGAVGEPTVVVLV